MLIARAPLRLSLAGGGTDLEAYYAKYGGAVVSTSIDKYFYVILTFNDSNHIQVSSSDYRTFYRHPLDGPPLWDGDLDLPKVVIDHFGIWTGLSVFLASQVPPGTGLGSSSTVAVALIKAMSVLCNTRLSRQEVAELACRVEIDTLKMPIGKQDQFAASFGGLNFIQFNPDGVVVEPLVLSDALQAELEGRLMLFFTGRSRDSAQILDGYAAGGVDYLRRPFSPEILRSKVSIFVELHRKYAEQGLTCISVCMDQKWPQAPYKREEALDFLAKAGFQLRDGALFDAHGNAVEFSVITNAGNQQREKIAEMMQQGAAAVRVDESLLDYALEIIEKTRQNERLLLGVSPRGSLMLQRAAQARAFIAGRDFCLPDDFKQMVLPVFAHRVVVNVRYATTQKKTTQAEAILAEIIEATRVPL